MHRINDWPGPTDSSLTQEIAHCAARMIAEEGMDYANAKRKAYLQITGGRESRIARQMLPSNEQVEEALREYQQIFQADHQPQRLLSLRRKALELMKLLKDFSPTVTGAIANGTAGEHSDIHLQCFADSAKDLGIFLLNQGLDAQATTLPHFRGGRQEVEALVIRWQGEMAVIAVYPHQDGRGAMKPDGQGKQKRLDPKALEKLVNGQASPPPSAPQDGHDNSSSLS